MVTDILDDKQVVETTPSLSFAPCENDTSSEEAGIEDRTTRLANIVLDHRAESTLEEIQGAVALSGALTRLKDDPEATKRFFEMLRKGNYLTKAEAEAGISEQSDSVVSKIRKIEKFSDILFKREIYRFLRPGIELLYEAAQLIEATGATGMDAVAKVSAILASSDGPIKRPWLKNERSKLVPKLPRAKREADKAELSGALASMLGHADGPLAPVSSVIDAKGGQSHASRTDLGDARNLAATTTDVVPNQTGPQIDHASSAPVKMSEPGESDHEVVSEIASDTGATSGTTYGAVLLTINGADAERLSSRASESLACFSAASSMTQDSVLFAFTTAKALLTLTPIVSRFHFQRCATVILLKNAGVGEISDHPVLAVFERGASLINPVIDIDASLHPTAVASLMLKDGLNGSGIHLFADVAADGWDTVLTKDAWSIV